MTELKEKIINTIKENGVYNGKSMHRDYYVVNDEELADALIAAGIGDVSDIRSLADNVMLSVVAHKAEVSSMEQRAKEAEHRAEVAERALFLSAKEIEYLNGNFDSSAEFFATEKVIPYFMKRAEKELAEEKEDD